MLLLIPCAFSAEMRSWASAWRRGDIPRVAHVVTIVRDVSGITAPIWRMPLICSNPGETPHYNSEWLSPPMGQAVSISGLDRS